MFGIRANGTELIGTNGGTVTVVLTTGKAETLMGLQGSFATSDATGHLHLAGVTASSAVSGMVVGGGFDGGAFLLSGSGAELSGGMAILTATYTVDGGTAAGSYSIPVTIEAATADGAMAEDLRLTASVNVTVKAEEVPPVPETAELETPAPAPTNNSNEGTNGGNAEGGNNNGGNSNGGNAGSSNAGGNGSNGGTNNSNGANNASSNQPAEKREEKAEEKIEEAEEVAKADDAAKSVTATTKKKETTLTTLAEEDVEVGEDGANVAGIVIGVVAAVLVIGAVVTLVVLQKTGKIRLGKKMNFKHKNRAGKGL